MRRFQRKSASPTAPKNDPPPTHTSPIVEYVEQELVTLHPRDKDTRALAAPTNDVPLSIAFSSCDTTDTALGEPESSKESLWKAAYGTARMAVEIAKDSSDIFPPLKAVMAALSVLIKNYDQTTANADQIKGVEGRILLLGRMLKHPASDQDSEEKARREALRSKLAEIIAKLRPLSERHGIVKFLKNVDHAKILNGFVQDLAYAVTDYQTSLQQSIHETTKRIDHNTKRVDETTNKIGEATNRIVKTTDKIDQTASKVDEITDRIDETANKIDGTTERIDETTERIDETTKNLGKSAQNIIEATDNELLGKLNPVCDAGYKAGHHDTCLRGTRESVLDGIMQWVKDPQDRHVFWLNGLAGTGKSTIAQTFSETVAKAGILGASFFCSRDYLDRRELKNIFPTLAYQLACRFPTFRHNIVRVIKHDPTVASNSLISQLEDLIVGPLSSSNIACVIVVDALDECIDDQPASAFLSVLGRHVKQLSSSIFFITGRPEPRIRTGFRLPLLEPLTQIFLLHEVKRYSVDGDIRLYLEEKLTAVSKRRSDLDLSDPWPCGEDLTTLTKKSSGLFIFASTLVKFIESEHHEPNERLKLLTVPPDSTFHEGRAGIDGLYTRILLDAFSDVEDTNVFTNLRRVLGVVVLAFNPLSRVQIAGIIDVNASLIARSLRHLHSVLFIPNEDSKEIRIFHKSFPDFLQDRGRCSDQKYFIDSPIHHGDIALDCLELLRKLKPNPCNLLDFVMNRDVVNLPELLEDQVGGATRYACGYWAMHIRSSPTTDDYAIQLIASATEFFEKSAVPWIEVMSLENRLEGVIHGIYNLLDWLGTVDVHFSDLRSLAQDCLRFTMHFFPLIQQSSSHIYHSALPLSPRSSTFHSRILREKTAITEFHGRPDAWGIVMRTIAAGSRRFACVTTFGHRIAAVCDDGTVGVYDSVTGVLKLSLNPVDPVQAIKGSPDGSVLFCTHQTPSITAWDMQTGGLIHPFASEWLAKEIAVSLRGRYLACGFSDNTVRVWEVGNEMGGAAIWTPSPATHFCWLWPEERLALSAGRFVRMWDIVAGTTLWSFTIDYPVHHMVYSRKLNQLAVTAGFEHQSAITTINPHTGKSAAPRQIPQNLTCFAFSQDTGELVCGMEAHGLQIFNVSTRHWRHIEYADTMTSVSSLPNGTVAANFASSGLQLLNLDVGNAASQRPTIPALTVRAFDRSRIIAVLQTKRNRIVLLELVTMSQLLTIHAMEASIIPTDRTAILCASLDNGVAVYSFEVRDQEFLQLWEFHDNSPKWTVEIDGLPSIGGISQAGARLVTFHDVDDQTFICVWGARNGQLKAKLLVNLVHPLDITFDSEKRFYSHHDTYRVPYIVTSSGSDIPSYSITRRGIVPLIGTSLPKDYDVDDTCEWVVTGSKRICWIPPGYIGSVQPSYCWAGNSLVMAGQDGTLRKLTFREPF